MKFSKLLALILAVCMLGTRMIAWNGSGSGEETTVEAATSVTISVTLIIKDANGAEVANEAVSYTGTNATLGEIIGNYCAGNDYEEAFDDNDLLSAIGELKPGEGELWIAYYENEGKNKAFASIKNQPVADGQKVVLAIDKA